MQELLADPSSIVWDDWVLFAAQVLTLIALVVYVWKTWEMAGATRRAAQATADATREATEARLAGMAPRVMVYFDPADIHIASVLVENVGAGTAKDVRIVFDPPLQSAQRGHKPNGYFETPKPFIPPSYRIRHVFDSWPQYIKGQTPRTYSVNVTYSGAENGVAYETQFVLDVESMMDRVDVDRKDMHDLVKQVESQGKALVKQMGEIRQLLEYHSDRRTYALEATVATSHRATDMLLSSWEVLAAVDQKERVHLPWRSVLPNLQHLAFVAASHASREGAPAALQEALASVLTALLTRTYFGDSEWDKRVTTAMSQLAQASNGTPAV